MENKKEKLTIIDIFTLVGLCMCAGMGTYINPVLQKLIEMYPETPVATVRMLSTIVSIISVGTAIPISFFFGSRIKYKPTMILAAFLTMCGALPFFFTNPPFAIIMLSRVLVGVGFALASLRNGAIRKMFGNDTIKLATMLGVGQGIVNISSMSLQPIAGFLADIKLEYCFAVCFIAAVPLLINIFLLKEPEDKENGLGTEKPPKGKANPKVFLYSLIVIILTLFSFPIFTGMSTLVQARGLGEAGAAGTVTSLYSVGCMVGSFIFGWQYKKINRYGMAVDIALLAIGFGLITIAQSLIVCIIGAFLCGVGFTCQYLFNMKWAGDISDAGSKAFASTLLTASISLGSFMSSYWINAANKIGAGFTFLSTDAERTYLVGAIIYAAVMILFAIIDIRPKNSREL